MDVAQTVMAGGSSLAYDSDTDTYIYLWKSDRSWVGSCRHLDIQLNEGTPAKSAEFRFR